MAYTFLPLAQELARRVGATQPSSVGSVTGEALRVVNWINEAYRFVWNLHKQWEFRWAEGSFNIAAASAFTDDERTYDPAGVFKDFVREGVRIYKTSVGQSDECDLVYMPYVNWRRSGIETGAIATGRPTMFTVLPDSCIRFDVFPDAQYTVVMDYERLFDDLTVSTDEPLIPDEFRLILVYKGMEYYGIHEEAPDVQASGIRLFQETLRDLRWDQLPDEDVDVVAV